MLRLTRAVLFSTLVAGIPSLTAAQQVPKELALATLEELMNIEVKSASRREQRAEDIPAAVYVIGRDEIRRSGMTTIPELLRLAPGVQVARINSNKWAVSVRGFNGLHSNKLLVMIDGRSIYNPAFSSVIWDTEDLMIEDIDHIEVIRGPGGAMWGANAVNGVINIITRTSTQTPGGLVRVSSGTFEPGSAAFRYGGAVGSASYRVFAQGSAYGDSLSAPGFSAQDSWHSVTSGFRADWERGRDALMFQGSATSGQQRPRWVDYSTATPQSGPAISTEASATGVANVVGRWTHTRPGGATVQAQAFFDSAHRDESIGSYNRRTWDVDAQYHTRLASSQDLVAGGGYRHIDESLFGAGGYTFSPAHAHPHIINMFAQDAIELVDRRVELTLGAKFEKNTFAGSAFQPNARVIWKVTPHQRLWAAVSRAVRTPSIVERGTHLQYPATGLSPSMLSGFGGLQTPGAATFANLPVVVGSMGNVAFTSERLVNVEGGYRRNFGTLASIDVVAFSGRYRDLGVYEPQMPELRFVNGRPQLEVLSRVENRLSTETFGTEVSARLQLSREWYIDGALSGFGLTAHANGSQDPSLPSYDGKAPSYQWRAHTALPLFARGQADVHVFRVGALRQADVDAFTRLDARVEWPLASGLSTVVTGQNLLQPSHFEFTSQATGSLATLVPRSGSVRMVWRF